MTGLDPKLTFVYANNTSQAGCLNVYLLRSKPSGRLDIIAPQVPPSTYTTDDCCYSSETPFDYL